MQILKDLDYLGPKFQIFDASLRPIFFLLSSDK